VIRLSTRERSLVAKRKIMTAGSMNGTIILARSLKQGLMKDQNKT
jgi:hypothetical protein